MVGSPLVPTGEVVLVSGKTDHLSECERAAGAAASATANVLRTLRSQTRAANQEVRNPSGNLAWEERFVPHFIGQHHTAMTQLQDEMAAGRDTVAADLFVEIAKTRALASTVSKEALTSFLNPNARELWPSGNASDLIGFIKENHPTNVQQASGWIAATITLPEDFSDSFVPADCCKARKAGGRGRKTTSI